MTLLLLIFFLLSYLFFLKHPSKKSNKMYILYITIVLILISYLRHEGVGNDTLAYMKAYENMQLMSWEDVFNNLLQNYLSPQNDTKDPGANILNKLLSSIWPNPRFYLFFVATVFLTCLGVFVYRNTTNIKNSFFFYVFYVSLFYGYLPNSAIRQTFALTLILLGYMQLQKSKVFRFVIFIILGSFFHKSALIVLVLLPFSYLRNVKLLYPASILLFGIIVIFNREIGILFMDSNELYAGYLSDSYYVNQEKPYMVVILMASLYLIGLYSINQYKNIEEIRLLYYGTAATFIFVPLIWLNPSLIRILGYFAPWMGVLVGDNMLRIKEGKYVFIIIILIFTFKALKTNDNYHFMWQQMELHERYTYKENRIDIDNKTWKS